MYQTDLRRLKQQAARENTSQQDVIEKALWDYYLGRGRKSR